MDIFKNVFKGSLSSILVVAGVALVAPIALPVVASMARPIFKGIIKGGMALMDTMQEFVAETGEQISDLVAEAKAERAAAASAATDRS
ncbi:DUF5132 domain-containing protein [Desulfobacca acetoxidans]|uniref:DUF5132 domain-containing protein n=1 Tax=Desulfobacca acetoxidans (strain ATCC 700848 / DSM 11109 / ASRB2) TaxID=880072 RepID=F2NC18_DESAR|nr:DUF5132 domain-containing protein [Desulfobacca acetoxidans]AEB08095.1 hypothetical protein Desac_0202 [Desulfobacca acetoxidans DSM 11109]HAY22253.1 DUF5132 domain-containing protein [Desulfobacterales bacterium]